jgi:FkbM family methyltransferase
MRSNNFRIVKPILDTNNYCGFKLRFRDGFADRYIMRDMLKRNYGNIPQNPKTVIDIGAHIGLFTLAAIRAGAEKIYAFEPEISNFEILCHNIKINGYEERVICIKKGVGAPGETKLYIHPTNSGGSTTYLTLYKDLNSNNYQKIDIISIHDVFDLYNIKYCELLKLDCEGSERDIINEFDYCLASKTGQIYVEIHDKKLIEELVKKLREWYEAECTNPGGHKGGNAWVFTQKR